MKDKFLPYKESLELKLLGFDEPCMALYTLGLEENNVTQLQFHLDHSRAYSSGTIIPIENNFFAIQKRNSDYGYVPVAPLYQDTFEWFRNKHNLHCEIKPIFDLNMKIKYYRIKINDITRFDIPIQKTHKDVELACIRKFIEIIKNV